MTDSESQTSSVTTRSTDAGSTWFQMVNLEDPKDYCHKYLCKIDSKISSIHIIDQIL